MARKCSAVVVLTSKDRLFAAVAIAWSRDRLEKLLVLFTVFMEGVLGTGFHEMLAKAFHLLCNAS